MNIITNYLITTFDGIGDGVIYYPIFVEVGSKISKSEFFYTPNLFFQDDSVTKKVRLPLNFHVVGDTFRKFPREHWEAILNFLKKNNIRVIINLRFIGRKFEKDYFDFKKWISLKNSDIIFFDDENLRGDEKIGANIRNIIWAIVEKALKIKLSYKPDTLKNVFRLNKQSNYVLINIHSRGTFKRWEVGKWAKLISSLVSSGRKIKIYEGFGDIEKSYTGDIIEKLQSNIRSKIEIINPTDLDKLIRFLRDAFLLISVDSGLVHLADSMWINSLGLYITTSQKMWGGITDKFHYIESKHMSACKNFYPYFGMCMNNKIKCKEILGEKDDISVSDVLDKVKQIFYDKN